jgi:ATP-dependent RNA helicase DeaD
METITFQDLPISQEVLQALEKKGYGYPTQIQAEAIGPLMEWKDVIAKAPTGTGKTFAFGIPVIEHIDPSSEAVQAAILAPTRELALQIGDELRSLLEFKKGIRVAVLYGGQRLDTQAKQLTKKPQIVVATPGRLMDHYKRKNIRFDDIKTVILDEADRMLDMGFYKDVTGIIEKMKNRTNMGLFSATISQEVMTVSWMYQRDEVEITVQPKEESRPDIQQYSISCNELEKLLTTIELLEAMQYDRVIIFCNTKHMCQRVSDDLRGRSYTVDCLHGDIRQSQREKVMQQFRDGKLQVLVATDVASRGIDVDDVDCVLNYDIPAENEYYIHRIGRTGRARKKGVAISLLGSLLDKAKLDEIAKYSNFTVTPVKIIQGKLVEQEVKAPVIKKKYK